MRVVFVNKLSKFEQVTLRIMNKIQHGPKWLIISEFLFPSFLSVFNF